MEKYQHQGSIVFNAHPACHGIRWEVPDTVANKHVLLSLKKQPYQRMKGEGARLDNAIAGLGMQVSGKQRQWTKHPTRSGSTGMSSQPTRYGLHTD
jgi:hypothetical protein